MRGPTWTPLTRVIPYWIDTILFHEPEYDEPFAWQGEIERFLDLLVSGLRTKDDLDLYRKSGIFERVQSLYFSTALAGKGRGEGMRRKILNIVFNTIQIEGGADMLITRVGEEGWLGIVEAKEGGELGGIAAELRQELARRCDGEYIGRWEGDRPVYRQGKKD
jgi:nucleolar pre-ribosomal-associated protein 1